MHIVYYNIFITYIIILFIQDNYILSNKCNFNSVHIYGNPIQHLQISKIKLFTNSIVYHRLYNMIIQS